jgi:hypothetical protein
MKAPFSTTSSKRFAGLPEWARPKVEAGFAAIRRGEHLKPKQAAILDAIENDPRMRTVWKELSERSRATGEFNHPMRPSLLFPDVFPPFYTAENKQAVALSQVVQFTFRIVVHPGYFAVRKPKDIAKARKKLLSDASILRRLATNYCMPPDAEALWRTFTGRRGGPEALRRRSVRDCS